MVDGRIIRVAEDAVAAAPELAILGLYGFVIYSNFATGSTSTNNGPGPNPLIGVKKTSSTANAAGSLLSAIQSSIASANASVVNPLVSALTAISPQAAGDVQQAQRTLQNWQNATQDDLKKAFNTLWGWVSGL